MLEAFFITPDFLPFLYLFAGIVALGFGSFTTALVHRLPRDISIIRNRDKTASRSACPSCQTVLKARDLIPVFSWCLSRGKCRHCDAKIPYMYPLVEGAVFALCMAAIWQFGFTPFGMLLFVLMPVLTAIIAIDMQHMIIPNVLNGVVGVLMIVALFTASLFYPMTVVEDLVVSACLGSVVFALVSYGFRQYFTWRKQVEAMGLGDIKFFAVAGAWLGIAQLPFFMLYGGIFGVIYAVLTKKFAKNSQFPFGPALVLAFLILIFEKKVIFLTLS